MPGDDLPKLYALNLGEFELERSWLAIAMTTSKRTRSPRRTYDARQSPKIAD